MPFKKNYIPWNKGLHVGFGTYRFPKGYTPWNKGIDCWNEEMKQRMSRTRKGKTNPGSIKKGAIPWNKGKELPYIPHIAHRGKLAGEKHPMWKGGITPLNLAARTTIDYLQWRKKIFERDNFTCQDCGKQGNRLVAHHVKAFSKFPDLRTNLNNGTTLCKECHFKTDNYGGRAFA